MTIKDFIEKLGMIHSSNPVTEETTITIWDEERAVEITDIDFDFKRDEITIIVEE